MTDSAPTSNPRQAVKHSPSSPSSPAKSLVHGLALAALLIVAAWIRVWCSSGEIWLDEVWTWEISGKLTWIGGLFSQLKEENNHYLNTLFVWLLRDQSREAGLLFRLPAVACGVASIAIAWRLGSSFRTIGERVRVVFAALVATSYLMVHYSSEARGYAYAVFFAALAFDRLWILEQGRIAADADRTKSHPIRDSHWLFPLACCGGFLSQPIFLTCFGAMGVWVLLRLKRSAPAEVMLPTLTRYFAIPAMFFVALYVIDLRHAANGGGDQFPLWRVVMETLSLAGGGPFGGWGAAIVAGLVVGLFVHGLRVMASSGDDRWVFHLLVVVVMPLGLLVVLRRAEVYPRYFLIAVFFLLQGGAVGLVDLLRRSWVAQAIAMLSLVGLMWGNGHHIGQLAHLGRNGYMPMLETLAEMEPGDEITLRSDHDFRHTLMFKYFEPLADLQGKRLRHVNHTDVPAEGTPWLLTHSLDVNWLPPAKRTVRQVTYNLRFIRRYPGLSGWGLAIYQRQSPGAAPNP